MMRISSYIIYLTACATYIYILLSQSAASVPVKVGIFHAKIQSENDYYIHQIIHQLSKRLTLTLKVLNFWKFTSYVKDKSRGLGSLPDNAWGRSPKALSGREPNPRGLSGIVYDFN